MTHAGTIDINVVFPWWILVLREHGYSVGALPVEMRWKVLSAAQRAGIRLGSGPPVH